MISESYFDLKVEALTPLVEDLTNSITEELKHATLIGIDEVWRNLGESYTKDTLWGMVVALDLSLSCFDLSLVDRVIATMTLVRAWTVYKEMK